MARVKGGLFTTTLDVNKRFPLDSRALVSKREDLINPATWITNTLATEATYNVMVVSVNSDSEYNGVYYLLDRKAITADNYSAYKTALEAGEDVNTYFSMWMKLGTLDDLAAVEKKLKDLIGEVPEGKTLVDMIAEVQPSFNLTPVDGTMVVTDMADGGKAIGVAIAPVDGNALVAVDGGLFVPSVSVPEYAIEKQAEAGEGYAASYRLKKTVNGEVSYVGDVINIAKDMMLKSATLETVTEVDVPYVGAVVGDPYIKMVFNDDNVADLYVPVKGLVDTYTAGSGIEIIDNKISVKLADTTHGLVAVDGALALNLATKDSDGAMSKEDKRILDAIPEIYVARKYEVSSKPEGTLVDYRDKEIRVMCPADTAWTLQNSGENADANMYYIGFKAYAPTDAVSFKEGLKETIEDDTMYYFEGEFAGVDAQGRKYSIVWLPAASHTDGTWTYYGSMSSEEKYIGWFYTVEWYDENGKIGSDTIRINLSNEDCHNNNKPYYMANYATSDEVDDLEESVSNLEQNLLWGQW